MAEDGEDSDRESVVRPTATVGTAMKQVGATTLEVALLRARASGAIGPALTPDTGSMDVAGSRIRAVARQSALSLSPSLLELRGTNYIALLAGREQFPLDEVTFFDREDVDDKGNKETKAGCRDKNGKEHEAKTEKLVAQIKKIKVIIDNKGKISGTVFTNADGTIKSLETLRKA